MPAFSKPDLPPGPHHDLVEALHALHHKAGWPSLRDLGRELGVSRTTVAAAFSSPRVPRWGTLELLVEALGGDRDTFHALWLAATTPPAEAPQATTRLVDGTARPATVPHQLPFAARQFLGRDPELGLLEGLPDGSIAVICGTAGVGKSALAVHAARRRAMPDGEYYVDLRGYDVDDPLDPAAALEQLLVAIGVEDRSVSGSLEARAALWRSISAGRRLLLLLDNARSPDQVAPLLPGGEQGMVLVTSRDSLPALVARYGAVRVELDRLDRDASAVLLRRLVGERAAAEPTALDDLAARCADLPLALRLAAERAAARQDQPLARLVDELEAEADRLDLLDAGDDRSAVRSVFSWSAAQLTPPERRSFALLGVLPGIEVDVETAAAVLDAPPATARSLLEILARLHLLERTADGFGMHDLLRAYARELAADLPNETRPARERFVRRVLDQVEGALAGTAGAGTATTSTPVAPARDAPHDRDLSRRAWVRAAAELAAREVPDAAVRLSDVLAAYLDARGYFADALVVHAAALTGATVNGDQHAGARTRHRLAATRRRLGDYAESEMLDTEAAAVFTELGDRAGLGSVLLGLGIVAWRSGRYALGREHLLQTLALAGELRDLGLEGAALYNLGIVHRRLGEFRTSVEFHERALDVQRRIPDRVGEGRALTNSGVVLMQLGQLDTARRRHEAALAIQRELDDRAGEAVALINLGLVLGRLDDLVGSSRCLEHAWEICRETGYRVGEADAIRGLGVTRGAEGRIDEAVELLTSGIRMGDEIGEADIATGGRNELGAVLAGAGHREAAQRLHREALDLARASGDLYEEARALDGLSITSDDDSTAKTAGDEAADLFARLGLPDEARIRERLG